MSECILVEDTSGISVIYPVGRSISEILAQELHSNAVYSVVEISSLPTTRVFRAAWRLQNGALSIDLDAAKEIQIDRWRAARAPLMSALDIAWIRAQEQNDTVNMPIIAAKKQALRDVTATDLSAIITPEELEAVWPDVLTL